MLTVLKCRDWEEGLPWLSLAAREVTQESTGFSPNDLFLGILCPLTLLHDQWRGTEAPKNLIDFVNGFRHRLYAETFIFTAKDEKHL